MSEQYARGNAAMIGAAGPQYVGGYDEKPSRLATDKPRIVAQLETLAKVIAECHQLAGAIENSADRIIGPNPPEPEKAGTAPSPSNIEQRLADLNGYATNLCRRLGEVSQRFNSAV